MTTLSFDETSARRVERAYMTRDVVRQREVVFGLIRLAPGEHVIDIGSGPGFLCESMADAVGPKGTVLGIDISEDFLGAAERRNTRANLSYRRGDATALACPDAAFDVAVSTQVLEYVADCDRALCDMRRVLRPQGRALVMATDWDSVVWHSSDPGRMAKMLRHWEAHCADPRLPRTLVPRLRAAGFRIEAVQGHPIVNAHFGDDVYSKGIAELLAAFVRRRVPESAKEVDGWLADLTALNAQGRYFFASTRFIFLAAKAA